MRQKHLSSEHSSVQISPVTRQTLYAQLCDAWI